MRLIKNSITTVLFCGLMLLMTSGCYLRNGLAIPGTKEQQRNRAVVHDPFPVTNVGPNIEGGRPFGYMRPLDETTNTQTLNPRPNF